MGIPYSRHWGEQYYLTKAQWEYITEKYDFTGIPTYMLFDKQGEPFKLFTGYPGNDTMQKLIREAMGE